MSHNDLWRTFKKNLRPYLDSVRIENSTELGTPDVYCRRARCWVELKFLPKWPRRATTKIRFNDFTRLQLQWLEAERESGGSAWLLAQVGAVYVVPLPLIWESLLGDGPGVDPDELFNTALASSSNRFPTREVLSILMRDSCSVLSSWPSCSEL